MAFFWICGCGRFAFLAPVCLKKCIFLSIEYNAFECTNAEYIMERFGLDCYLNNDNFYCLKDKGKNKDLFQTSSRHSWFLPSWRDV